MKFKTNLPLFERRTMITFGRKAMDRVREELIGLKYMSE
jgi:hypothetical protein